MPMSPLCLDKDTFLRISIHGVADAEYSQVVPLYEAVWRE